MDKFLQDEALPEKEENSPSVSLASSLLLTFRFGETQEELPSLSPQELVEILANFGDAEASRSKRLPPPLPSIDQPQAQSKTNQNDSSLAVAPRAINKKQEEKQKPTPMEAPLQKLGRRRLPVQRLIEWRREHRERALTLIKARKELEQQIDVNDLYVFHWFYKKLRE